MKGRPAGSRAVPSPLDGGPSVYVSSKGRVSRSIARSGLPAAEMGSHWAEGSGWGVGGRRVPTTPAAEKAGGPFPTEALALPLGHQDFGVTSSQAR